MTEFFFQNFDYFMTQFFLIFYIIWLILIRSVLNDVWEWHQSRSNNEGSISSYCDIDVITIRCCIKSRFSAECVRACVRTYCKELILEIRSTHLPCNITHTMFFTPKLLRLIIIVSYQSRGSSLYLLLFRIIHTYS